MLCGERTLVKAFVNHTVVEPLRCKCWSCDHCAPYRAAQLRHQAAAGKPLIFITITVNPAVGRDIDDRAGMLFWAWRAVRRRAMRRYGYVSIPFIAVFETTDKGEPHLHILCRVSWIDQDWLSKQMAGLIAAPIVWVKGITETAKAANYIAKYIGKDPQPFKGRKRYWASHDYKLPPGFDTGWREDVPWAYDIERESVASVGAALERIDYVFVERRGRAHVYQYGPYYRGGAPMPP